MVTFLQAVGKFCCSFPQLYLFSPHVYLCVESVPVSFATHCWMTWIFLGQLFAGGSWLGGRGQDNLPWFITQRCSLLFPTNTTSLCEMLRLASNHVWQCFCHQPYLPKFSLQGRPVIFRKSLSCCFWDLLLLNPLATFFPTSCHATFFRSQLLLAVLTCT